MASREEDEGSNSETDIEDFTQNVLERAKLRQQMYSSTVTSIRSPTRQIIKPTKSLTPKSKASPALKERMEQPKYNSDSDQAHDDDVVVTENIQSIKKKKNVTICEEEPQQIETFVNDNENDESDVESELENELNDDDIITDEEKINTTTPLQKIESFGKRRTMKRLGELYTPNIAINSPVHIHSTLEKTPEIIKPNHSSLISTGQMSSPSGRLTRLNALASNINSWENDSSHITFPSSRFNMSPPKNSRQSISTTRSSPTKSVFTSSTPTSSINSSSSLSESNSNNLVRNSLLPTAFVYGDKFNKLGLIPEGNNNNNCSLLIDKKNISINVSPKHKNTGDGCRVLDLELKKTISISPRNSIIARKLSFSQNEPKVNGTEKSNDNGQNIWDKSVLKSLEAQGFVSNSSKTKLIYEYNENLDPTKSNYSSPPKSTSRPSSPFKSLSKIDLLNQKNEELNQTLTNNTTRTRDTTSPTKSMDLISSVAQNPITITTSIDNKISPPRTLLHVQKTHRIDVPTGTPRANLSVAAKTALFETKKVNLFNTVEKDPALMTVAERTKLFERQALFGNKTCGNNNKPPIIICGRSTMTSASSVTTEHSNFKKGLSPVKVQKGNVENQRRLFEAALKKHNVPSSDTESEDDEPEPEPEPEPEEIQVKPVTHLMAAPAQPLLQPPPPPPPMCNLSLTFSAISSPIKSSPVAAAEPAVGIRTPIMSSPPPRKLTSTSRSKISTTPKRSASPSPTRRSTSPKLKYPGSRDIKRIRVNEPKPGRMYPSLTDIETTETETEPEVEVDMGREEEHEYDDEDMDSETSYISGSSLGTHIERVAKKEASVLVTPRRNPYYRPTEDFSTSLACRQIDECIDDALEGQDCTMDTVIEAELNAVASSTPIACSTGVEDVVECCSQSKISWKISDEVSRKSSLEEDVTLKASQIKNSIDEQKEENSDDFLIVHQKITTKTINLFPNVHETESNIDTILNLNECTRGDENNMDVVDDECNDDEKELGNEDLISKMPLALNDTQDSSCMVASSPLYSKHFASPIGTPLIHTVSTYRKQQEQTLSASATPKRIARVETSKRSPSPTKHLSDNNSSMNELIRKLEDEVSNQQRSIAQVSKALNLCKSTVEFSESTENIECERILLIATQKRTGLLNEIHRLKTEGVLTKMTGISPSKHDLSPSCQGNMTMSDISIQFKRDFVTKAMNGETVYHFICMARYRNQLESSSLVSIGNGVSSNKIHGGVLSFSNTFCIPNLEPDFQVKLEFYVLQTMKEFLPHEAKYHIKRESNLKMTPKKSKKELHSSKAFSRSIQQSPAGPDAVRSSNFNLCGSLSIDISTLHRTHWNIEGTRFSSPLEGSASIKIQCCAEGGVEERGFLTLFDDVSGFGAWHRRWCKLTPAQLSFWMYPEDENKKAPLGCIQLRHCVTSHVGPVPRDVCARTNTFLLVTTRCRRDVDKDSLVTSCHSDYTAIRHLMSADTKEERDLWCKKVSRALANLRAWDPQAQSPNDSLF